jgi:hypothetical protein
MQRARPALQVTPAAATPDVCRLALAATSVTAGTQNVRLRLSLADTYGNLLTKPAHLTASAALTFTAQQLTVATVKTGAMLAVQSLPLVPTSVANSNGIPPASPPPPVGAGVTSAIQFEGTGSDIALAWSVSLTAAGVHRLKTTLGSINTLGAPADVTVAAADVDAAASRVRGPSTPTQYAMVAGVGLGLRLQAADAWQNFIPAPAPAELSSVAAAEAFVVNWADGLALGTYSNAASLALDTGSNGAPLSRPVQCTSELHIDPDLIDLSATMNISVRVTPWLFSVSGSLKPTSR